MDSANGFRGLMAQVQANSKKLRACKVHFFPSNGGRGYSLGDKLTCFNCGGTVGLSDAGSYVRGYVAAGGDSKTVFPDWSAT